MARIGWKTQYLFPEARPLCKQCRQVNDRNGLICSDCKRENQHNKKAHRPIIEGYLPNGPRQ